jgi:hypothetical protein
MVPRAPLKATNKPKPATPYLSGETKKTGEPKPRNPMMGDKLSMEDWDVDPMKIVKQLVSDRNVQVDEHSGMVTT